MPILPFQPDVLKHNVTRITVGQRIQIDAEACLILNARLAGVDGNVTATIYTDDDPNFVSDNPDTADSEKDLIALAATTGASDSQNPLAPPTRADFGIFVKAEGTTDKVALLELTYVHRVDYEQTFEPIKVETVEGGPALAYIADAPGTSLWSAGTDSDDGGGGGDTGGRVIRSADGLLSPIGSDPGGSAPSPTPPTGIITGGHIYFEPDEIIIIEGQTDTFKVRLDPAHTPLKDVVISVTSSATGDLTVSPSTLTFTPSNFTTLQNVTLTAVDDASTESTEAVQVTLAVSGGDGGPYSDDTTTLPRDITVRVVDTDSNIAGVNIDQSSIAIVEGAAAQTLNISLTRQPSANVTVQVGDTYGEGRWETGVSSSYAATKDLTFTNANWLTAQDITIRATTNTDVELINPFSSPFTATVTASTDANYSAIIGRDKRIPIVVYDNDATNFGVGMFILQAEHGDYEGNPQSITTESGSALIRNE
mgnify:CR=1 FL=1